MDFFNNIVDFYTTAFSFDIVNVLISLIIILTFIIFSGFFSYVLVKFFQLFSKEKCYYKKYWLYTPLKMFFSILGFYISLSILQLPNDISNIFSKAFKICIILLVSKSLVNLFSNDSHFFREIRKKLNFKGNDVASSFVSKIIAGLIYIVAGFIVISELGYDLGGLATGLGISSVVIALATQDLIKSLFSGFSIIYDKAFEIGDYIDTKEFSGTVEDITFKSTKIRNLDDQIITIPNSILVDSCIVNSSKINNRRYYKELTIEFGTPIETVHNLINSITFMLMKNENIIDESICVFFDNISDNGITIYIQCYSTISDLGLFRKLKESLNYAILALVESSAVSLAYSTQTINLRKDN